MMRNVVIVLLLIMGSASALAKVPPSAIWLTAQNGQIKLGEPITVDVKVTNTSKHAIGVIMDIGYFYVYVINANGTEVKRKPTIPDLGGSAMILALRPSESVEKPMVVSGIYDIRQPGTYLIRFTWRDEADLDPEAPVAVSNLIRVTVTK
jgi:hypothetical protein